MQLTARGKLVRQFSWTQQRLSRYEAHLSREFDRTLSQLERLERMRLGHPRLEPMPSLSSPRKTMRVDSLGRGRFPHEEISLMDIPF
jgi:hypothetical protein